MVVQGLQEEKKMKASIILFLIIIIPLSGCTNQTIIEDRAVAVCVEACNNYKENLSNGPCLLNPMQAEENFPNLSKWVCDVAHSPRQNVDNQIENQCSAFREGIADHFVEVDTNCKFIQAY